MQRRNRSTAKRATRWLPTLPGPAAFYYPANQRHVLRTFLPCVNPLPLSPQLTHQGALYRTIRVVQERLDLQLVETGSGRAHMRPSHPPPSHSTPAAFPCTPRRHVLRCAVSGLLRVQLVHEFFALILFHNHPSGTSRLGFARLPRREAFRSPAPAWRSCLPVEVREVFREPIRGGWTATRVGRAPRSA